jgi:hypothetical protein
VAWEWGDPGATLEVFEAGPMATVGELVRTTAALRGVPSLMSGVSRASEEIIGAGCTATLLPGRSARTGEPTATLLSPAPGEIDLRAWLHTPGEGITWARILDTELVPWEEAAVAAGTREILGSSNDSKQLFYLQGRFPVPAGAEFSGTVEFWFQADAGGDPRRIGAFPITVPSR